jgi:predicted nucleotidyltransferase
VAFLGEVFKKIYDEEDWSLFKTLRRETRRMVKPLTETHIDPIVYGSVARGDVSSNSDIDVFIPNPPSPTLIESALLRKGFTTSKREIIQATPNYAVKGYIYLDEDRSYSFPLMKMRASESEFYGFAGKVDRFQLLSKIRVAGVNKELMLIEPTETGHVESEIRGRVGIVAKKLNIDVRIVRERIRTLERREEYGRTGIFVERVLDYDESFGQVMEELRKEYPGIRRRLRKKS